MKLFEYLNIPTSKSHSIDARSTSFYETSHRNNQIVIHPMLNQNNIFVKETKLSQNGNIETNDLFSYKDLQPQTKFAEYYKYNAFLSSESEDEYELPVVDNKRKKVFKNCEYVVTSPVESNDIDRKNQKFEVKTSKSTEDESEIDLRDELENENSEQNVNKKYSNQFIQACCLTSNCSIM